MMIIHTKDYTNKKGLIETLAYEIHKDMHADYEHTPFISNGIELHDDFGHVLTLKWGYAFGAYPEGNIEKRFCVGINTEHTSSYTHRIIAISKYCRQIENNYEVFFGEPENTKHGDVSVYINPDKDTKDMSSEKKYIENILRLALRLQHIKF